MSSAPSDAAAECRRILESALDEGGGPTAADLRVLAAASGSTLVEALRAFADERGARALPLLSALAVTHGEVRRAAKRALYRLSQRGISAPAAAHSRPVVTRDPERATRAWVSAIDGSGSRAVWIVIEGGYQSLSLCSVIISDTTGIVEVAGGEISKKRLDTELAALRAEQKLPWVESDPSRAVGLIVEALELHAANGTAPPAGFARWTRFFERATPVSAPAPPAEVDAARLGRSMELLELPEFAGWFLDPETLGRDALELLEARESRLVLSDQLKAEREEGITDRVVEREFTAETRTRWTRRLMEMATILDVTARAEPAALARAAAAGFADSNRHARHHPLARALARRGLDVAGEVALGRVSAADVSRKPGPVTGRSPASHSADR